MAKLPVRKKIRLPQEVYENKNTYFITIATHKKHPWFSLYPELR